MYFRRSRVLVSSLQVDGMDDREEYKAVTKAFGSLGFKDEEVEGLEGKAARRWQALLDALLLLSPDLASLALDELEGLPGCRRKVVPVASHRHRP